MTSSLKAAALGRSIERTHDMDFAPQTPAPRHSTAKDYIYDAITTAIIEGHFAPGERLLEKDVSAWLEVSRTPVREALSALEGDGLVEIMPHRGAVVRRLNAEDVRDLYVVRAALESLAAELAVGRAPATLADELAAIDADLNTAMAAGDIEGALELNRRFHFALYEQCGSSRLTASIASAWRRAEYFRRHVYKSAEGVDHEEGVHAAVVAAVRDGDGVRASAVVKTSLLDMGDQLADILTASGGDTT